MCDGIFRIRASKDQFAEMRAVIVNYNMRGSEVRENVLFQELDNNLVVIHFARNGFNPFRLIVHNSQNVLVPK